jgi:hypothetical protein
VAQFDNRWERDGPFRGQPNSASEGAFQVAIAVLPAASASLCGRRSKVPGRRPAHEAAIRYLTQVDQILVTGNFLLPITYKFLQNFLLINGQ